MWWYITFRHATYALRVERGRIVEAPPISRWMVGMYWTDMKRWISDRGGHGSPL